MNKKFCKFFIKWLSKNFSLKKNLSFFKIKNIAIIGSSPISLASSYVLCSIGHNVTIFEQQNRIGGAWSFINFKNINVPESTHIIMDSNITNKFIKFILRIKSQKLSIFPKLINLPTFKLDNFYYKNKIKESYCTLRNHWINILIKKLKKKKNFKINLNQKVKKIVEEKSSIFLMTDRKKFSDFHKILLTPGSNLFLFKCGKKIDLNFLIYENKSIIFEFEGPLKFNDLFVHVNGVSMIREINILRSNKRTFGILKLSRYCDKYKIDLIFNELKNLLSIIFKDDVIFDYKILNYSTYKNYRMTPKSQKKLTTKFKYLSLLPYPVNTISKKIIQKQQDLSKIFSNKQYYTNLINL